MLEGLLAHLHQKTLVRATHDTSRFMFTFIIPESTNEFTLLNDSIDDDRPYKVVVLGAGLSGILAGIRFYLSLLEILL